MHRFGAVLRSLVGLADPKQAEAAFTQPICEVGEEETCFDLLSPLVIMFVCQHVLESPEGAPVTSVSPGIANVVSCKRLQALQTG